MDIIVPNESKDDGNSTQNLSDKTHYFFAIYVLDHCKGSYTTSLGKQAQGQRSSITCSNGSTGVQVFRELVNLNVTGALLSSDDQVQLSLAPLQTAKKAISAFFVLSIVFLGCSLLLAIVAAVFKRRTGSLSNLMVDWVTSIVVAIATTLSTAICLIVVKLLDQLPEGIGISAVRGERFFIITWAAVGLLIMVSIIRCLSCLFRII